MRVPPSGRVPKHGPDGFLMATEACGGETPDLGSVLEVWGYIRGVGVRNKSGGSPSQARGRGAPSTLVVDSGLFWSISNAPWASSGPKIAP